MKRHKFLKKQSEKKIDQSLIGYNLSLVVRSTDNLMDQEKLSHMTLNKSEKQKWKEFAQCSFVGICGRDPTSVEVDFHWLQGKMIQMQGKRRRAHIEQ